MFFLFYFDIPARKKPWNGRIIREGGVGVSGSETTFVAHAEYLGSNENGVCMYSKDMDECMYRNVYYSKTKLFNDRTEVLWIHNWDNNLPTFDFPNLKCVIIQFACVGMCELSRRIKNMLPHVKQIAVYPSQWAKEAVHHYHGGSYIADHHFVVHNTYLENTFYDTIVKIPRSFVWLASWERGGDVALRTFRKLQWPSENFFTMDYMNSHNSYDKQDVSKMLSKSDYFVYPLVLGDGRVHKDTFACCVSEALAHEVIVISFEIAALKDLYSGVVDFIPFPRNANVDLLQNYDFMRDYSLLDEEVVDNIIQIINYYESNPDEKVKKQKRNREFARSRFTIQQTSIVLDELVQVI
jgi:glycosyltransferase involved in cell wall biosynthesis